MENKIFIINEDERERILQKHKEATKNVYLNVINENNTPKDTGSYVISPKKYDLENAKSKLDPELRLFRGATFQKTSNDTLTSNTKFQFVHTLSGQVVRSYDEQIAVTKNELKDYTFSGTVTYFCKKGKFKTDKSGNYEYYDEDKIEIEMLNSACKYNLEQQTIDKNYTTTKEYVLDRIDSETDGSSISLPKKTMFIWNDDHKSYNFMVNNFKSGFFTCKDKNFRVFGSSETYTNQELSTNLINHNNNCKTSQFNIGGGGGSSSTTTRQTFVRPSDETINKLIIMIDKK